MTLAFSLQRSSTFSNNSIHPLLLRINDSETDLFLREKGIFFKVLQDLSMVPFSIFSNRKLRKKGDLPKRNNE